MNQNGLFFILDTLMAVNISEAVSKGDLESLGSILFNLSTTAKKFISPYGNLLHISASLAKLDHFKKILDWSNLSVNIQNPQDGSTALHIASRLGRYEIVEYLLSLKEIDDTLIDNDGRTCLDCCKNKQIKNLIECKLN